MPTAQYYGRSANILHCTEKVIVMLSTTIKLQHERKFNIVHKTFEFADHGMLMIRGKRPFHSSYDSREDSHLGRDTSSLGTSTHIMLSAYLLFPHYAQCLPIIPALCSVLTYYSRIMLNAFWYLLFSKLCQHNPPNPSHRLAPLSLAPLILAPQISATQFSATD